MKPKRPKHPRARRYFESGIYDGLTSFSELKQRIKNRPEPEHGDAFEVFAEAYLATQKICQAKEIWPSKAYTTELISQFNLGRRPTVGNDGLYETVTGDWHAYEAKFRLKQNLTWTEISSFFGRTEQFHQRVVITSCNHFATEIENAPNTTIIRGNDLARLDKIDFDAIHQWLDGDCRDVRVGGVQRYAEPDETGCNWNVHTHQGPLECTGVRTSIVDELRRQYNLQDD